MLIFAISAIVFENINMILFASLFALIQFCTNFWLGFYAFLGELNNGKGKKYMLSAFIVVLITILFFWAFSEAFIGGVREQ